MDVVGPTVAGLGGGFGLGDSIVIDLDGAHAMKEGGFVECFLVVASKLAIEEEPDEGKEYEEGEGVEENVLGLGEGIGGWSWAWVCGRGCGILMQFQRDQQHHHHDKDDEPDDWARLGAGLV